MRGPNTAISATATTMAAPSFSGCNAWDSAQRSSPTIRRPNGGEDAVAALRRRRRSPVGWPVHQGLTIASLRVAADLIGSILDLARRTLGSRSTFHRRLTGPGSAGHAAATCDTSRNTMTRFPSDEVGVLAPEEPQAPNGVEQFIDRYRTYLRRDPSHRDVQPTTLGAPLGNEPGQIRPIHLRVAASLFQPTAQMRQQPQLMRRRPRRVAHPRKLGGEPVHVRRQRPRDPNPRPVCHARSSPSWRGEHPSRSGLCRPRAQQTSPQTGVHGHPQRQVGIIPRSA